jgi:hypothetical protein
MLREHLRTLEARVSLGKIVPPPQKRAAASRKFGDFNLKLGRVAEARKQFREALEISQALAQDAPKDAEAQLDLAEGYGNLVMAECRGPDYPAALGWLERGTGVLERLHSAGLVRGEAREQRWQRDMQLFLEIRIVVLLRLGRHAEAAAVVGRLPGLPLKVPDNLYRAACGYALCFQAVAAGKQGAQLTPEETAARERYAGRAVALLGEARAAGFFRVPANLERLKQDNDLAPLRQREDFRKLLAELEGEAKRREP